MYLEHCTRQDLDFVEEPLNLRSRFADVLALESNGFAFLNSLVLQRLHKLRLLDCCTAIVHDTDVTLCRIDCVTVVLNFAIIPNSSS